MAEHDERTAPEPNVARSQPLSADAAQRLDTEIELMGVDEDRITLDTEPARDMVEMGRVDANTVRRQVVRAAIGAVAGAVLGLIVALIVTAVTSVPGPAVAIAAVIIGALLGGLWSLYVGLPANPQIEDAYATGEARLAVDLDQLDPRTASRVEQAMDRASPDDPQS